jgi:hemerythrin
MAIQWNEELATGVLEIDNQHKEIFARINRLLEASSQGKGKEEVGRMIDFLGDYVISHFGTEEKYMQKTGYPDYISHKSQHDKFISEYGDVKKKFEKEGSTSTLVIEVMNKSVHWLINHITKVDKVMAAYLREKI